MVCVARHLRQSLKGKRIRGENAETVYRLFGEYLAIVVVTPQGALHVSGHRRLVKYEKEELLSEARVVSCPFQQEWICVRPHRANSVISYINLLKCRAPAVSVTAAGSSVQPLRQRTTVANRLIL